ncbi:MAG: adenosylmethionine decarboxylase [Buchnera aphidicola (Eriosoma harunire)]
MQKIKLYGFNNLTKSLNFCIYDICYANTDTEKNSYIRYIDDQYNAIRLTKILQQTCSIIGANILNVFHQDYEPQGASVTILVCEDKPIPFKNKDIMKHSNLIPTSVVAHLDKSHICVHTYPEIHPHNGICTFRADIEISTCGIISPLNALNYLINKLESDIVTIEYRIRGFTRDVNGIKYFIDHDINSIQNFMSNKIKSMYDMIDVNLYQENIFHTRMLIQKFQLKNYLFSSRPEDLKKKDLLKITNLLVKEMKEIYYGKNIFYTK